MAARLSTGLVNKLLVTNKFNTIFAACFIDIYSGTQPASADDVPTGTKLCTVYSNGTSLGLNFDTVVSSAGTISKAPGETWSTTVAVGGTAGWFRMREASDPGTGSTTTLARYDGSIATSGAQMNLGNLTLSLGAPFVLTAASFTLPQS